MEKSHRSASANAGNMQRRRERRRTQPVRIEQNDYREPNKLMAKLKQIGWQKIVLCIAAVYTVVAIGGKILTIASQKAKQQDLLEQQAALELQLQELQKQEAYVGSEEYIEQAAREKFGWVKEGEIVFKEKDTAE